MDNGSTGQYFIGLDLGQSRDFTAIAILERAELTGAWDAEEFAHRKMAALRLRYLERIPLGTTYPDVVERVRQVTRSAELRERCYLMVDATGVGRPVVDLLRMAGLGCPIMPAIITVRTLKVVEALGSPSLLLTFDGAAPADE